MKRALTDTGLRSLFHVINGTKISGPHSGLWGDCSGLRGNCSGLYGDCSRLWGDCSGLRGDCTGLWGDLDDCDLSDQDRENDVDIRSLINKNMGV